MRVRLRSRPLALSLSVTLCGLLALLQVAAFPESPQTAPSSSARSTQRTVWYDTATLGVRPSALTEITTNVPLMSRLVGVSTKPERLSLPQWQHLPAGPNNAITDVPGVRVGHVTYYRDFPHKIRTGVTAVVPDMDALNMRGGNLATLGLWASGVTLNGNGELTGLGPLQTEGILNGPILLGNTRVVGRLHDGVHAYFHKHFPGQWSGELPVVGECWDGFFSSINQDTPENPVITPQSAMLAIESAQPGPVPQGRVGAGTGMRSFGLHAGIGSASRQIKLKISETEEKLYTVGVLVNTNHSRFEALNPVVRSALETRWGPLEKVAERDALDKAGNPAVLPSRQGSIIVVIATDLPLDPLQLRRLAEHAALGIGNTGSFVSTFSGDFAVAFSTAQAVPLGTTLLPPRPQLHPDALNPVFQATVEAVTEAQLNALVAARYAE